MKKTVQVTRRVIGLAATGALVASWASFVGTRKTPGLPVNSSGLAVAAERALSIQRESPRAWAHFPEAVQDELSAIDAFLKGPPLGLDSLEVASALLRSPDARVENQKRLLALVVVDMRHAALLGPMIAAISPTQTPAPRMRAGLLSLARRYVALHGGSDFGPAIRSALLRRHEPGAGSSSVEQRVLNLLLADLGVPHK